MQNQRHKFKRAMFSLLLIGLATGISTRSFAQAAPELVTFGAEYIQDWDEDCTPIRGLGYRYYAKPKMLNFVAQLKRLGGSQHFLYSNGYVWSSDSTDKSLTPWGQDHSFADTVDLFAYQGHGGTGGNDVFFATMCLPSGWKSWPQDKIDQRERFRSSEARFDQQLRWLIMSTCHSLESRPDNTWGPAAGPGFEYVMGYRGTGYTAPSTDDILEDWVTLAFDKGYTFKQAWFDASEDWYFSLTPSVLSFDDSKFTSTQRRDNLRYYWDRRKGGQSPAASAWAWKRWGGIYPARRTAPEKRRWEFFTQN